MYLLCNEHRVPTDAKVKALAGVARNCKLTSASQVKYVLTTACLGFPALQEFKAESESPGHMARNTTHLAT